MSQAFYETVQRQEEYEHGKPTTASDWIEHDPCRIHRSRATREAEQMAVSIAEDAKRNIKRIWIWEGAKHG